MNDAVTAVLPFALAVALSPIPLIAVVAVLLSARARTNGLVFLVAWFAGLTAIGTVAFVVADTLGVGADSDVDEGVRWLRVVTGVALVALAARTWHRRPGPGDEPTLPGWMTGLDDLKATRMTALALALSLNPKNLLLGAAAGASLADATPATAAAIAGVVLFAAVASAPVTAAVAVHRGGGPRTTARLEQVRSWLERNNAVVLAAVLGVLGVVLVVQGSGFPG